MPKFSSRIGLLTVLAFVVSALGACGKGTKVETEQFVYASLDDCADAKRLTLQQCSKAIDAAIVEHEQKAAKYPTMSDCEKKEGADRCERFTERHYRPKLMGYHFTVNEKVVATPLYAALKGKPVFRDAGGKTFDWQRTEGVKFSQDAISKSRGLEVQKPGRRG